MVIEYPLTFWALSLELAEIRHTLNEKTKRNNPKYDRGKLNIEVDALGVMGELIARHYLDGRGVKYKASKLIALHPEKMPDFIIDNLAYDVKGVKAGCRELRVNQEAHQDKTKKVDSYWYVIIEDNDHARILFVPYDEVSGWEVKQGFSPYYAKQMED